jgi:predicted nucleotide-binding protein with TIR-like domain
MMNSRRPAVFVGGPAEHTDLARAIQQDLSSVAEVTIFTQEVSRLSASIVDTLLEALDRSDCAIFVFPPVEPDSVTSASYRDSLLQLGMMMGLLGRDRTYVVVAAGTAQSIVPTPLLGLAVAEYDAARADANLRGALGVATTIIRDALSRLAPRVTDRPAHSFAPEFEEHLRMADDIFFWGMNQSDFIIQHFGLLEERLGAGVRVRALLVDPDGDAVRLTRLRFTGAVESTYETYRSSSSLIRLHRLREAYPHQVELRTLDYPFSYGGFILAANGLESVAYTKRYTFRVSGGSKKPKAVHKQGRSAWFDLIEQETDQMWKAGSEWICRDADPIPGSSSSET